MIVAIVTRPHGGWSTPCFHAERRGNAAVVNVIRRIGNVTQLEKQQLLGPHGSADAERRERHEACRDAADTSTEGSQQPWRPLCCS
jgi:hypothetical protein